MLGFAAASGALVECEGAVVGGKNGSCDSEGVSDKFIFSGDEFTPAIYVSDPCESLECFFGPSDADGVVGVSDEPGEPHIAEAALASTSYDALLPTDPGFDLTRNSAVSYVFDAAALEDVPESGSFLLTGAAVTALVAVRRRRGPRRAFSAGNGASAAWC
jgi:hypothetical protein